MTSKYQLITRANREVVIEGVARLRDVYETFIHEKQAAGYDFKFVDGQMIGHNFFKQLLFHIADEMIDQRLRPPTDMKAIRQELVKIAIDTLRKVVEHPETNETDPTLS